MKVIELERHCEACGSKQAFKIVPGSSRHEMCCLKCGWILATCDNIAIGAIQFAGSPSVTTATVINMVPQNTGGNMAKERKNKLMCSACKAGVENSDGYCPHCNHPLLVSGNCGTKLCLTCTQEDHTPEDVLEEGGIADECLICDALDESTCADCPVTQH